LFVELVELALALFCVLLGLDRSVDNRSVVAIASALHVLVHFGPPDLWLIASLMLAVVFQVPGCPVRHMVNFVWDVQLFLLRNVLYFKLIDRRRLLCCIREKNLIVFGPVFNILLVASE